MISLLPSTLAKGSWRGELLKYTSFSHFTKFECLREIVFLSHLPDPAEFSITFLAELLFMDRYFVFRVAL
jgi:hypothetical protein